jgi:hypothetical protein
MREILLRCLLRDPGERFQSARELGDALEHELYSRGHGPTFATLARYMEGLKIR